METKQKNITISKKDGERLNNLMQRIADLLVVIPKNDKPAEERIRQKKKDGGAIKDDIFKIANAQSKYDDELNKVLVYQNNELDMLNRRMAKGFDGIEKRLDHSPGTSIILEVIGADRKRLANGGFPEDDKGQMEYFISLLQGMMKQGEGLSFSEEKALDDLLKDYERKYGKR